MSDVITFSFLIDFVAKTLGEQTHSKFFSLKHWGSNCSPAPASAPHGIDLRLLSIKPTYNFKARYAYEYTLPYVKLNKLVIYM